MRILHILLFVCCSQFVSAQTSPFNKVEVDSVQGRSYSFVVSGHFYGGQSNQTHLPCNTILAEIDALNASEHKMLVCLGDLFKDVKNDIPFYEKALFSKLKLPLFNAVGNHDLSGDVYQSRYGATNFSFEVGNDYHLFLDTEENDSDLDEEQLRLLKQAQRGGFAFDNIFIYSHRTIWKDAFDEMDGLFADNTQSLTNPNFEDEVLPILKELNEHSEVYWMSGSMGDAPASFFYEELDGIHFMATAIRGLKRDALLEVVVQDGKVSFKGKSLTGQDLLPIESYNIEFWKNNNADESFNWRLLPLYIKTIILHYVFWIGVIVTLICVFIFNRIKKRRAAKLSA